MCRLEFLADGRTTEPRHLGADGIGQPGIGFEGVVHRLGLLDAVVAAGGHRAGQEAVAHLGFQISERRRLVGAHRVLQFGARGDDVGHMPAVGDDAVHLLPGRQLLTQQPDCHLRDGRCVGGVDTPVRRGRRMRFPAAVIHLNRGQRQRPGGRDIHRAGMHHHGDRQVVEDSGVEQQDFSTAELFSGRAQEHNRQTQLVGYVGQGQRGADRRCGNDVVAAGMTDPGQRVVFGAHANSQRTAAEVSAERGVQSAGCRGDLETPLSHQRLRLGATAVLGERQLRFGVDRMRQLDEVGAAPPHRVLDVIQHRGWGHRRSISPTKLADCGACG